MRTRLELHEILCECLGSRNVYFQPPESIKLEYPCIVYNRSDIVPTRANNSNYMNHKVYDVIVIDPDPDSEVVDKVSALPYANYDRHYAADNLNHDAFTVYF